MNRLNKLSKEINELYIENLEKAFDKACNILDDNDISYINKDGIEIRGVNKEQWKEWLLKDD